MGTTATLGLPYPEPSDLVTNGAAAIKALADALDAEFRPCMMRRGNPNSPVVNIPNASPSTVGWPLLIDSEGSITWLSGSSEIQIDVAGRYDVIAALRFSANATGRRAITVYRRDAGGTLFGIADSESAASASGLVTVQATILGIDLAVGDKISASAYQDSGALRPLVGNETSNYLSVVRRSGS